ncbi:MAG: hypothetical protein RLZZ219_547 [Cyanobacteriota bacterium]
MNAPSAPGSPSPEGSASGAGSDGGATTGRRSDGRLPQELRETRFLWDPMGFALSSVTVQTGRTSVICSVCLEDGVPKWLQGSGRGWLSADYRLLPASTPSRQPREWMKLSGRTQEIQRLIGRSLRACLDLEALGERSLQIDCDVLQADAGTRTAAITGAWAALAVGLRRLEGRGVLTRSPLQRQVAAVSVGLVDGRALLDLDYSEDSRAAVDLNVVMDDHGQLLEIQGTAEGDPFSRRQLGELLDLAESGLSDLLNNQRLALAEAED